MPFFVLFGAGVATGLWLRSEADTDGMGLSDLVKWASIGGGVYVAGRYLKVL